MANAENAHNKFCVPNRHITRNNVQCDRIEKLRCKLYKHTAYITQHTLVGLHILAPTCIKLLMRWSSIHFAKIKTLLYINIISL